MALGTLATQDRALAARSSARPSGLASRPALPPRTRCTRQSPVKDNSAGVRLMAGKDVSFGIRLEADLARVLEDAARESGRSRNELVAEAIRQVYGGRIELIELKEAALAEADRAVRDRLSVVEVAIRQVLDRISAIESTMKDVQDELLALETNTELDPVERARRRTALKQDLAALAEALETEKAALEDLRAQRQALLGERARAFAEALRPRLEEWLGIEGTRLAQAISGLLTDWLSGLNACLDLSLPAHKRRALRYVWLSVLGEIARTAPDEGVRVWARSQLPPTAADWDWARAVELVFADYRPRVPADHTEVGHDTDK